MRFGGEFGGRREDAMLAQNGAEVLVLWCFGHAWRCPLRATSW
jgi:hypothetical protein